MSYDTSIIFDACGHCGLTHPPIDIGNMTSNVGRMYREVLPGPFEGGGRYNGTGEPEGGSGLHGLSGLRCSDVAPLLREAVDAMDAREAVIRPLEPANGWGSFDGARRYLRQIAEECEAHPTGALAVNW